MAAGGDGVGTIVAILRGDVNVRAQPPEWFLSDRRQELGRRQLEECETLIGILDERRRIHRRYARFIKIQLGTTHRRAGAKSRPRGSEERRLKKPWNLSVDETAESRNTVKHERADPYGFILTPRPHGCVAAPWNGELIGVRNCAVLIGFFVGVAMVRGAGISQWH